MSTVDTQNAGEKGYGKADQGGQTKSESVHRLATQTKQ